MLAILVAAAAAGCGTFAWAANGADTWTTGVGTGAWSLGSNWTGANTPPISGDSLIFGATAGTTTLNDDLTAGISIAGITFNSGGPAYTISGNSFNLTGGIIDNATNTETINDAITMSTAQNFAVTSGGTLLLGGALSGSGGGITTTGLGTLTLTGASSFTGTSNITINSGTLNLGGGTATGSISGSALVLGGGTFNYTTTGTNTQTFTGTSLNAGYSAIINSVSTNTLALGAITRTAGGGGAVNFTRSGTITTSNSNDAGGILGAWATFGNAGTAGAGATWATVSGGNIVAYPFASYTQVSPTGSTSQTGAGATNQNWLSGVNNGSSIGNTNGTNNITTVTTTATINTLTMQGDFGINSGVTLTLGDGGLVLSGISRWLINNGAGSTAGTGQLTSGLASGELFVVVPAADATANNWRIWTKIIDNGATAVKVVKTGPGFVELANANTYTGNTYLNAGTLGAGITNAFGTTGTLYMNGGTLTNYGAGAQVNLPNAIVVSGTNAIQTANGGSAQNLQLNGAISGSGNLTLGNGADNASLFLNWSSNTMTSGTVTLANNTNSVRFSATTAGNANLAWVFTNTTANRESLDFATGTISFGSMTGAGILQGNSAGAKTISAGALGLNDTFSGTIADGTGTVGLTKVGAGTMTLSGANTYSGNTLVSSGTLALGNNLAIQNSTLDTAGAGVVSVTGFTTPTLGGLSGSANLASVMTSGYNAVTALTLNPGSAISDSYSGFIANGASSMTLTKTGAGLQILSGANTYTGATSISAGTLQFAQEVSLYNNNTVPSAGAGWTAANISVASGATLAFNVGGSGEFSTSDITTLLTNLDGAVNNNGLKAGAALGFDTTNASGGNFIIANAIANTTGTGGGAVGVTKLGANTLTLTGNNSFTGGISFGSTGAVQLQANAGNTTGGITSVMPTQNPTLAQLPSGATIQLRADSSVAAGGVVSFDNGGTAFGVNGTGTRLTGTLNFDVNQISSGANLTLQFGSPTAVWQVGTGTTTFNVTGGNGYTLQLGSLNIGNNAPLVFNPTTANLSVGSITNASTGTLTKNGAGTLTLTGANNYTGQTTVSAGTLNFPGSLSSAGQISVGAAGGSNAVMNIQSGANITLTNGKSLLVGAGTTAATGQGFVYQTGGSFSSDNPSTSYINLQLGAGASGASYGYYNLSGANSTLSVSELDAGSFNGASVGVLDITGGTMTVGVSGGGNGWLIASRGGAGSTGIVNLTGGTLNYIGPAGQFSNIWTSGTGIFNVKNATLSAAPANIALSRTSNSANLGQLNLLSGGLLQAHSVAGTATGTYQVNFNGGTLKAGTTGSTTFLSNLTATVYGAGGTIDNNGQAITVPLALVAAAGSGVTASGVTVTGGSGYLGAPAVTFSGGGGTGAAGYVTVAAGAISGLVITNPGTGYTSAPTVNLTGGGGTGASITLATPVANTSGGMTFTDSSATAATTTLTAQSTYTGPTLVSGTGMTLAIATNANAQFGTLGLSSQITVNSGATISLSTADNNYIGFNGQAGNVSATPTTVLNSGATLTQTSLNVTNHLGNLTLYGGTLSSTATSGTMSGDASTFGLWSLDYGVTAGGVNAAGVTSTISSAGVALTQPSGTVFNVSAGAVNGVDLDVSGNLYHATGVADTGLIKSGVGVMRLSAANTYTGSTRVNAGTLVLNTAGTINNSSGITINGSGAKLVQLSSTAIAPIVTLTNGTLDGTGTIATVNVGIATGGIITNGNGATSPLTIGALSFAGGATVTANVSAPATPGIVTTTLATTPANGSVLVNASNALWNNGSTYNLISYTGADPGLGSFTKGTIANLGARQSATLTDTGSAIALIVAGDLPIWTGLQNGTGPQDGSWTAATGHLNWKLQTAGTPTNYIEGDTVVFDDTAGALGGTTAVNISDASVNPTSTTFNNSVYNYTVSSSGGFGIASGLLIKSGSGTATITTANTYSGGTTLNAGTLALNNASAIGTGTLTITGGTLDNTSGGAITLTTNNTQIWNGDFAFGGSNNLNLGTGVVTLGGNRSLTLNGSSTLTVGGVISGNFGLATAGGGGTLLLSGANIYTGGTTVGGGTLRVGNPSALGPSTNSLTVNAGTLDLNGTNVTVGVLSGVGGTITTVASSATLTASSSANSAYSGTLSDTGGSLLTLTKAGAGILALGGANAYSGGTNINGGELSLVSAGAIGSAGTISFAGGSLQYTSANTTDYSARFSNGPNQAYSIDTNGRTVAPYASGLSSSGGSLSVFGGGSLTLAGANSYSGATTVNGATLNVTGAVSSATAINVGVAGGANSVLNISTGGIAMSTPGTGQQNILVGAGTTTATGQGFVYQSGGAVTAGNYTQLQLGAGASGSSYGYYNLSGGTLAVSELDAGAFNGASVGVFDMTAGTMSVNQWLIASRSGGTGSVGIVNLTGGTLNYSGPAAQFSNNWGTGGTAIFNLSNSTLNAAPADVALNRNNSATNLGEINLLAGSLLQAHSVAGNTAGTSQVNFNGGTLKAGTTTSATFLNNLTATVYGGGGTIDNNGQTITIPLALVAPSGSGVTATGDTVSGGSGYLGAPAVTFSGGGGAGAAGYVTVSGGAITGLVITNPGTGYTSAPTVNLTGGGGAGASVTLGALIANSSGGMTFQGTGTTTLSAANTYTGATNVTAGTLYLTGSLTGSNVITSSTGVVTESVAGIIAGSGVTFTQGSTGLSALNGTNTYSGGSTVNAGTLAGAAASGANSNFGTGPITVNSGGILRLGYAVSSNTNLTTTPNNITLAGGSLFVDDAFQHVTGTVNITAASTAGSTYNAAVNTTAEQDKGLFLDGVVSGSANLTLQQSGINTGNTYNTSIVHFTNNANTYSGTITVKPMTTGNGGGSFVGVDASSALANATVDLSGGNNTSNAGTAFGTSPVVFKTGIGSANLGAVKGSANVVLTGYDQVNHAYGADGVALNVGGNNSSTTYSGRMSGLGSVTKAGTGVMTLTSANTYSGATTISGGTLRLASVALPTPAVAYTFATGGAVNSGATSVTTTLGATAPTFSATGGPINGLGSATFSGGTTSYIDVVPTSGTLPDLGGAASYTIATWIKTTTAGSAFLYKGDLNWANNDEKWYLTSGTGNGAGGTGTHVGGVQFAGGWVGGSTAVNSGAWTFVAIVRSGGSSTVYVNGVADGTSTDMHNAEQGTQDIRIGWAPVSDGASPLVGSLSGTYVYSSALTQAQLQALMSGAVGNLPATTALQLTSAGAALDLNGIGQTVASLSGVAASHVYLGGATLRVGDSTSTTYFGTISDGGGANSAVGGSVVKVGSGTLTLSAANAFSGSLQLGGNNANTDNDGAVVLTNSTAAGTGVINITSNNAGQSILQLDGSTAPLAVTNPINFSARNNTSIGIQNLAGNNSLSGDITMQVGGSQYTIQSDAGTLSLGNIIQNQANTRNLVVQGAGNVTIAGVYGPTTATNNATLTMSGAGTLTLSAANTYTGGTTISSGTLRVANSSGSATGTGPVALNGGTLASATTGGTIAGVVTAGAGATAIAPGDIGTVGAISLGSLTINGGTTLHFDASGLTSDLLNIPSSPLAIASGVPTITFDTASGLVNGHTYTLATFASSVDANNNPLSNADFNFTNVPSGFAVNVNPTSILLINASTSADWNVNGNGAYSNVANWSPGVLPSGVGLTATFGNGVSNVVSPPPATVTVTVDGAYTVGSLAFANTNGTAYALANGGAGAGLTLDNGGSGATISVAPNVTATQSIGAKLTLNDNLTFNVASRTALTLTSTSIGESSPAKNVKLTGGGSLTLQSTTSTYTGSTTIDNGALTVGSGSGISSGALTLDATAGAHSSIRIGNSQSVASLNTVNDNGSGVASLRVDSGAALTVSGTSVFKGATDLQGGSQLNVASGSSLRIVGVGTPIVGLGVTATVASTATLELDGQISALADSTALSNPGPATNPLKRVALMNDGSLTVGNAVVAPGGTSQQVGGIDGAGSITVNDNASLIADHVSQTALVIGSGSVLTLAASDATGNPTAGVMTTSPLALVSHATAANRFGRSSSSLPSIATTSASLGTGAIGSLANGGAMAVPEPSTLLLAAVGVVGALAAFRRRSTHAQR